MASVRTAKATVLVKRTVNVQDAAPVLHSTMASVTVANEQNIDRLIILSRQM